MQLSRNFHFLLMLVLVSLVTLTTCKKDEKDPNEATNDALAGDWDVDSFTLDGVEAIGFSVNSFSMEFTKQGPADGETEWLLIDTSGGSQTISGDYEIQNEGTEIDFEGDDFEIEIEGDDLTLEGNVNGTLWIIRAERD